MLLPPAPLRVVKSDFELDMFELLRCTMRQYQINSNVSVMDFSLSTNLLAGLDVLSPVPRLGELHRLATREERGTQDRGSRVHQASQQEAVRPMEDSNT